MTQRRIKDAGINFGPVSISQEDQYGGNHVGLTIPLSPFKDFGIHSSNAKILIDISKDKPDSKPDNTTANETKPKG